MLSLLVSSGFVFQEDFEGAFPPSGWVVLDHGDATGDSWEKSNRKARSGTYSALVDYTPASNMKNEWLVTPAVDLSGATHALLMFYEDENYWPSYGDLHEILVSTTSQTDTTTFTSVLQMSPNNHAIRGFGGPPVIVDISPFAGNSTVYIAFRYRGQDEDNWYIDDVSVYVPYDYDVRPLSIVEPSEYTSPNFTPRVKVQNYGNNTITSLPVRFILKDPSGSVVYNQQVSASVNLDFLDTATITFPAFNGSADLYYEYNIITELASDMNRANDTVRGYLFTYSTPMMVLFERFTQHNCGPCAAADPYQLNIYRTHLSGDQYTIGMITYHAWWPGSNNDPFYKYDTMPQRQRILYYGVTGVPDLWLNGVVNGGYWTGWSSKVGAEESYRKTPLSFTVDTDISKTFVREDATGITGKLTLTVNQNNPMLSKAYRLRVVIVQDSVYYNAPNGTDFHIMKFRHWIDTSFTASSAGSTTTYQFDFFLPNPTWSSDPGLDVNHLAAVFFVQSDEDHKVWGVGTFNFRNSVGVGVAEKNPGKSAAGVRLLVRNAELNILSQGEREVDVSIFSTSGRKVFGGRFLVNGKKSISPDLPEGVYFYVVRAGDRSWYGKLLYLR